MPNAVRVLKGGLEDSESIGVRSNLLEVKVI